MTSSGVRGEHGASEKAITAARESGPLYYRPGASVAITEGIARQVAEAMHDPALGLDRSVNERWCREDQTRRIVAWIRWSGLYLPDGDFADEIEDHFLGEGRDA